MSRHADHGPGDPVAVAADVNSRERARWLTETYDRRKRLGGDVLYRDPDGWETWLSLAELGDRLAEGRDRREGWPS